MTPATALADIFREEAGRVVAALMRRFRDFDLAEECAQDALVAALESWPRDGVPDRPGGWLITVASRRALNRIKRDKQYLQKLPELSRELHSDEEDDRLRLILTCCHPALSREAQVGLTLRAVCGFTTAEIARAFVASEATVAQRLARAKRKIATAGIPYRVASEAEIEDRLEEVFAVLYLLFNEAHLSTSGEGRFQRDLAEDAAWLCQLISRLLPREAEALGLLALMKIHLARGESRFDTRGELVLLADQDRSRWNRELIAEAIALIYRAGSLKKPGPYQLEAAIAACHAEASSLAQTDWVQIVALYDLLLAVAPSPVVRLNRAIAVWQVDGPKAALSELDLVAAELDGYHIFHATRGEVLAAVGLNEQARAARLRALNLAQNYAERSLLEHRLFQ